MTIHVTLVSADLEPGALAPSYLINPPSRDWVSFEHLASLTGPAGLYEHAEFGRPRRQGGYSLDDNGRALVVISRARAAQVPLPAGLADRYLDFVLGARDGTAGSAKESGWGWRDRKDASGRWLTGSSDDAVGRALWGLGAAAGWWPDERAADLALDLLLDFTRFTSTWWRPIAYTILGFTAAHSGRSAVTELVDAITGLAAALPSPRWNKPWPWPEEQLTYDNARLPEALIAAGHAVDDPDLLDDGLRLLEWLMEKEIGRKGFSFTPVAGRGFSGPKPAYDQQPIEAWAMADATIRAGEVSGDPAWIAPAQVAVSWFMGLNDQEAVLYDPRSGACFDGLTATGANLNQGAESTLSALGAILAILKPAGSP